MKTSVRLAAVLSVCLATTSVAVRAHAQELLTAGDFEATIEGGEIPHWTLEEFINDGTMDPVGAAALVNWAVANAPNDVEGGQGLWLQAFNGGDEARNYNGINAILSQVVPVTAGQTYTLTGNSNFEQNYSGGVATLDPLSPIGVQNGGASVATPTQSIFEIEWLDGTGTPVGTAAQVDLVNDDFQFAGGGWLQHTVSGTAPAGATQARISAKAIDMVENIDPSQSGFYDNFSFTDDSAPGTELLSNGTLNEGPPTIEDVLGDIWTIVETEGIDVLSYAGFANNGDTGGSNGVWVRAFAGDGGIGSVEQVVEAAAGVEYTFNASSRFETNFADDQGGGENQMLMELSFLDGSGVVIDTASYDLRVDGGQTADNAWHDHSLTATAPAGTAQIRVAGVTNNIYNNPAGGAQSAFWDDFSLMAAIAGLAGDFNEDGTVDAADYTVWRDGFGTTYTQADYDDWAANYGATSAPSSAVGAVPEPAAGLGCLTAAALAAGLRRRRG